MVIKEKANINELSIPLKKLGKENNCPPPKKWMNEDTEINEKKNNQYRGWTKPIFYCLKSSKTLVRLIKKEDRRYRNGMETMIINAMNFKR